MQMEQAEEERDPDHDLNTEEIMLNMADIRLPEAKYLLEKLLGMAVNQSCLALQKEGAIKEMENRMTQAAKQNTLHQQLLQHMIEQQDLEIYDLMLANENGDEDSDSDSNEDLSSASINVNIEIGNNDSDSSFGRREKARRKMTTKEVKIVKFLIIFDRAQKPRGPKSLKIVFGSSDFVNVTIFVLLCAILKVT